MRKVLESRVIQVVGEDGGNDVVMTAGYRGSSLNCYQVILSGAFLKPDDTCPGNFRSTAH